VASPRYSIKPLRYNSFLFCVFAAWLVYNSLKAKHTKPQTASQPILSNFQHATPEEREKMLEARGFTKYTDENGNARWKAPKLLADWAKAEKVDVVLKNGSMEIEMEKEGPKIRCSYCWTVYDEKLSKCPSCGASRQGDEKQDPLTNS
jgi:rubrerythrin